jgi:hypothetical protein
MQVEKRKLYRLDIAEFDDPKDDYIWLERIGFTIQKSILMLINLKLTL